MAEGRLNVGKEADDDLDGEDHQHTQVQPLLHRRATDIRLGDTDVCEHVYVCGWRDGRTD